MQLDIPQNILNFNNGDTVSFAKVNDTAKTKKKNFKKNLACYAGIFNNKSFRIYCQPNRSSPIPLDTYLEWMELCKKHKMFPAYSKFSVKGKKYLFSTRYVKNGARHKTYIALCCYRWADSRPAIPCIVVELCKQGINFFQALHYAMAKYVWAAGHSFCGITTAATSWHGNMSVKNTNLLSSIGIYRFLEDRTKYSRKGSATYSTIGRIISGIFSPKEFGYAYGSEKYLEVPNLEAILWKEWRPFYENPDLTKKQMITLYNRVLKSHKAKEIQKLAV